MKAPQDEIQTIAALLAAEHLAHDPDLAAVYWAPDPLEKVIRLLQVTRSVEDRGELFPFRFTASPPDIPYESVIVVLSPGDWKLVESGQLALPDGFPPLESLELVTHRP